MPLPGPIHHGEGVGTKPLPTSVRTILRERGVIMSKVYICSWCLLQSYRREMMSGTQWSGHVLQRNQKSISFLLRTWQSYYLWLTMIFSFIKHKHICLYKKVVLGFWILSYFYNLETRIQTLWCDAFKVTIFVWGLNTSLRARVLSLTFVVKWLKEFGVETNLQLWKII